MSRHHPSVAASLAGAAAIVLLLAGCAELQNAMDDTLGGSGMDPGGRTVAYECEDNRDFSARFSGDRDDVRIRTGEGAYDLQLVSRRGDRRVYSDDDDAGDNDVRLTLGDNGRRARLDIPREGAFEQCYADL